MRELGLLPGATARAGVQGNLATLSPKSGLPGAGRETPRIRYTPLYLLFEGFVRFSVLMTMIRVACSASSGAQGLYQGETEIQKLRVTLYLALIRHVHSS